MFTKQNNTKQKVYKHVMCMKQQFTDKLYLQNKTKVFKHVMFTKQKIYRQVVYKTKQNNETESLQNKNKIISLQTRYVYNTKPTENKYKMFKALCHFTTFSVFHRDVFVNLTYFLFTRDNFVKFFIFD